jgi:hypothetical protein
VTDAITVRTNLPDFKRQLNAIRFDLQKRGVANANRAAVKVVRGQAETNAPIRTGRLKRAIWAGRNRRISKPGTEVATLAVYQKDKTRNSKRKGRSVTQGAFYWYFLEGGWIPRGPGQKIRGGTRRRALERERLIKAGAKRVQFPFLANALRTKQQGAIDAFNKSLQRSIDRYNRAT